MFKNVYQGRKVLVTGHTGFKGSWLCLWLKQLGAEVAGLSNGVPTVPSHYELIGLKSMLSKEYFSDIRDYQSVHQAIENFQPEILFHLAAEPIVSTCIAQPKLAFDTNLGGTVNVLESLRLLQNIKAAVIITSDKCYENVEWEYGYRENDQLGGKDPYSASKACAEIAFSAYYRTYFANQKINIATARAGNVIGGGDWAKDRIIADSIRGITNKTILNIRSPKATRPWQHVLEPLSGYLNLAADLFLNLQNLRGESFNFGPKNDHNATVEDVLVEMKKNWNLVHWQVDSQHAIQGKEAGLLKLNCDKAMTRLHWHSTLNFNQTIQFVSSWYENWHNQTHQMIQVSTEQIAQFTEMAKQQNIPWTK